MRIPFLMSKNDIRNFVCSIDEGNWLESQPPMTANAPICKCGCGEPYEYDIHLYGWEVFCLQN